MEIQSLLREFSQKCVGFDSTQQGFNALLVRLKLSLAIRAPHGLIDYLQEN